MGTIVEMKVRCYNIEALLRMKGITKNTNEHSDFLHIIENEYNLKVFQPDATPGSGRARKARNFYVTTNDDFDRWVKLNNTVALLKDLPPTQPTYKKLPYDNTKTGLFQYD